MPSPNQAEKEKSQIFFNIFELDPDDEYDSIFISFLNDIVSKLGRDTIALLPREDLRSTGLNVPVYLAA